MFDDDLSRLRRRLGELDTRRHNLADAIAVAFEHGGRVGIGAERWAGWLPVNPGEPDTHRIRVALVAGQPLTPELEAHARAAGEPDSAIAVQDIAHLRAETLRLQHDVRRLYADLAEALPRLDTLLIRLVDDLDNAAVVADLQPQLEELRGLADAGG